MKIVYPDHLKFLKKLKAELKRDKASNLDVNQEKTINTNEWSIFKSIWVSYH